MSGTSTSSASPVEGPAQGIDISKALTFFFDDPNWVPKILVGSMFALLTPVLVGWVFVIGYAVTLAKRTMQSDASLLPEWDDINSIFIDGLKGVAIWLAHKLPVFILAVLLMLAFIGGALVESQTESIPEAFFYFGVPVLFGGWLLVFLLAMALLVYVPAAFVRFIRTDQLSSAFDVMENVAYIRENGSTYLSGLLAIVVAGFIGQLGFIVFCIGIFPGLFWAASVTGYVVGELARLDGGAEKTKEP